MDQESAIQRSPSTRTGTNVWPDAAISAFSVKRHGIVSTGSFLCAKASRMRQQYGLNLRSGAAPARSYIRSVMRPHTVWTRGGGTLTSSRDRRRRLAEQDLL